MQSCCNVDFQLIWRRSFANPLFAIEYVDLTNDGMEEIAVASLSGLHVLQVSVNIVVSRQTCRGGGNGSPTGVVCVWGGVGEGDTFPPVVFTLSMQRKEGMESILNHTFLIQ